MDKNTEIEELKRQIEELKGSILPTNVVVNKEAESINVEEKEEYSWEAPIRVFKKWEKSKVITVSLWVIIILLILIFLQEYMLVLLIILLSFVSISLVVIPPTNTKHIITNKGIHSFNKLYLWENLTTFWVSKKNDSIILYVNTKKTTPSKLLFILPQQDIHGVLDTISNHIKYYEMTQKQGTLNKFLEGSYIKFNDIKDLK